jgi:hypothetical protein
LLLLFIFYFLPFILKEKKINLKGNNSKIDYDKVSLLEINPTTSNIK